MQLKSIGQALDIRSDFLQDFEAALYAQDEPAATLPEFHHRGRWSYGRGTGRCLGRDPPHGAETRVPRAGQRRMQIWLVDSNERVLKNFSPRRAAHTPWATWKAWV
jgi:hypothetical protein